jgi:integrase
LVVWADRQIVQVVKPSSQRRVRAVQRRLARGCLQAAEALMQASQGGKGVINTAEIERLTATFRTWLPAATRRSRTMARQGAQLDAAMFWMAVLLCLRLGELLGLGWRYLNWERAELEIVQQVQMSEGKPALSAGPKPRPGDGPSQPHRACWRDYVTTGSDSNRSASNSGCNGMSMA